MAHQLIDVLRRSVQKILNEGHSVLFSTIKTLPLFGRVAQDSHSGLRITREDDINES